MSWAQLGIDPKSLADSAKSTADSERLAASRVDAYLDRVMAGQAQPVSVPTPLKIVLMDKYDAKVNSAGIDRAVERAPKLVRRRTPLVPRSSQSRRCRCRAAHAAGAPKP